MNAMYKCLLFGAVLALLLGGVAEATPVVDDFSTDTSADYTGSNTYKSGGSFTVNSGGNGLLQITTGSPNTYIVIRTTSALAAGERYAIDSWEPDSNATVFSVVSTRLGQPSSSYPGFRFVREGGAPYMMIKSYGCPHSVQVSDLSGPLTLWTDRISETDFRFYAQKPGGNRILIAEASNTGLSGGTADLHVGMQGFGWGDVLDFDNLLVEAIPSAERTVSFAQGVEGYAGTVDTYLDSLNPDADFAAATTLIVNKDTRDTLLRFDNIIGSGEGQIPMGSEIVSATLWLQTQDGTAADTVIDVHRLLTGFNNGDTWNNSFGGDGVDTDDVEAVAAADFTLGPNEETTAGWRTVLDVTTSLQAWADGQANEGWLITESVADEWIFSSSEGGTPVLTVTYIPEPSTLALAVIGLLSLGALAWRRRKR